jgi:cytoskeletal protein CcmA (bactofilin family)
VSARNVINAGTIEGNVLAHGKLSITGKGRVRGKIMVHSLYVCEGGMFNGECRMDEAEQPAVLSLVIEPRSVAVDVKGTK